MYVYSILKNDGADDSLREGRIVMNGRNIVRMKMNLRDLPGRSRAVVAKWMMLALSLLHYGAGIDIRNGEKTTTRLSNMKMN
jgi:hypothetical protein